MINLDELIQIGLCILLSMAAINCVFYFLTPKDMRPDEFDPWDFK
jgi:hypothetical protein